LEKENVKEYFNEIAREFDDIYDKKGNLKTRIINKIFRKSLYQRVPLTVKECMPLKDKSILDIGCGSGRISFLLSKEGAEVTGIDYSEKMIELAKERLEKEVNLNIDFFQSDFMKDFSENKKYDVSLAIGVFDYVQDPLPILSKMRRITKNKFVSSFPAKFNFFAPLRKVWLSSRNCPVYFYTEQKIKQIFSEVGINDIKIVKLPYDALLPVDYIVTANCSANLKK